MNTLLHLKNWTLSRKENEKSTLTIIVPSQWQLIPELKNHSGITYYKTDFEIPENNFARLFLRFNGVFYRTTVHLNEKLLGTHEGYFAPFEFEITNLIQKKNSLSVKVECYNEPDKNKKRQIIGVFGHWDSIRPDINVGGIWRNVEICGTSEMFLKNFYYIFEKIDEGYGRLELHFEIDSTKIFDEKIEYIIEPDNFNDKPVTFSKNVKIRKGITKIRETLRIDNPVLWWSWDQMESGMRSAEFGVRSGESALYKLTIRVGKYIDKKYMIGLRSVVLKEWQFYLNEKRIFLRGSNLGPTDEFLCRVTEDKIKKILQLVKNANINILRIHAHVEVPEFYELADRFGIMLFQDFPLQWLYSSEIKKSAVTQIREMVSLLRNHPSIVIWCCHNESFYVDTSAKGFPFKTFLSFIYNKNRDDLDVILERTVKEMDTTRPVILASGLTGLFFGKKTDVHFYAGWYFSKFRILERLYKMFPNTPRMMTEYGAQALPKWILEVWNAERRTSNVERGTSNVVAPKDWQLFLLKNTKKFAFQPWRMEKYVPMKNFDTLENYIEATQEYQAEVIKYHNEFLRKIRYRPCGGAFQFMFHDCSKIISWAIVDYELTPKKGYYALQQSFEPVLAVMDYPKEKYKLNEKLISNIYLINDTLQKKTVRVQININRKTILDTKVEIEPDTLKQIFTIQYIVTGPSNIDVITEVDGKRIVNCYSIKTHR